MDHDEGGLEGQSQRLWMAPLTKDGFKNLKPAADYDNLFRSARSEADWLVGLNVTRALTCKYNAQLSAGRVQTPTISSGGEEGIWEKAREYWGITAKLQGWPGGTGKNAQTFDRNKAEEILKSSRPAVAKVERQRKITPPPPMI